MSRTSLRSSHVVGIFGGLGNQLFQYCWALRLMQDRPVRFDLAGLRRSPRSLELERFGFDVGSSSLEFTHWIPFPEGRFDSPARFIRRVLGPSSFVVGGANCDDCDVSRASWWYGYWQQRDNALSFLGDIRTDLPPLVVEPGTIGVHVRRGDFVGLGLNLSAGYYSSAVAELTRSEPGIKRVVVYSDDPAWCQREFRFDLETLFAPPGDPVADLLALACHEFLVLSRGTFGWWASYLRERDAQTVVAPEIYLPGDLSNEQSLVDPAWRRVAETGPGWCGRDDG